MRRPTVLLALALLALPAIGKAQSGGAGVAAMPAALLAAYRDAARELAATAPGCDAGWREAMRPAFAEALVAWRRFEATGVGSAGDPETTARVYFWPDKHGTAGRQLATALRARDPRLETAAGLEGQSAALQSLASLEQLLHGERADDGGDFACRYARAIAAFQAERAAAMTAPDAAPMEALFAGLRAALDTVIALDLERPLGRSIEAARGQRARAWRSGLSLALIDAALATVEEAHNGAGGFVAQVAANAELAPFARTVAARLAAARAAVAAIPAPLHLAVADPALRPKVEALLEEVRAVRRLAVERLAPALGVAAGFNALDGD